VQHQPKVLIIIAALGLFATATPAAAGDRVAIVGCDLLTQGGPTATFLQVAGGDDDDDRSGFVFRSGDSSRDVAGQSCARVLADLADDGFEFRASVSGPSLNELVSILQDDD
jgi:hypothetical protein